LIKLQTKIIMKRFSYLLIIIFILLSISCKTNNGKNKIVSERQTFQQGIATWYGPGFHGKISASGEIFNTQDFTAAHRTLKFGTIIRVTNKENGKWCIVKINDRGPVSKSLAIDLSNAAANEIDMLKQGSAKIEIDILSENKNFLFKIFDISKNLGKFKNDEN